MAVPFDDIDESGYGDNTEIVAVECEGPECEMEMALVRPGNGRPYIPGEHFSHQRFAAAIEGTVVPDGADFCSARCLIDYISQGAPLKGKRWYVGDDDLIKRNRERMGHGSD